jgi:hypothetical protein
MSNFVDRVNAERSAVKRGPCGDSYGTAVLSKPLHKARNPLAPKSRIKGESKARQPPSETWKSKNEQPTSL